MKKQKRFAFRHAPLESYLMHRFPVELPDFVLPLAMELHEQTRGMDFKDPDKDGQISVGMFEHSFEEVCHFVDWATEIWNGTLRMDYRSRRLSTEELVSDVMTREGSARDGMLILFEGWYESKEHYTGPYLSLDEYPLESFQEDPLATIGNICAAFGLAVLDQCLLKYESLSKEAVLEEFGVAWQCATFSRWLNHSEMNVHFDIAGQSARMARAARARHSRDPKQQVKGLVRELWQRWEETPSSYRSTAAFARAMLDKWPDDLSSTVVVERWVRKWRRERLAASE